MAIIQRIHPRDDLPPVDDEASWQVRRVMFRHYDNDYVWLPVALFSACGMSPILWMFIRLVMVLFGLDHDVLEVYGE